MHELNDSFLEKLKNGEYKPVLASLLEDDTLDLELRGKKVAIYYRGGLLFSLEDGCDYVDFNTDYGLKTNNEVSVKELGNSLPLFKHYMDLYLSQHNNYEKEFQQLVARANNYTKFSRVSKGTDFYIADFEYVARKYGRYDLVGFRFQKSNRKYTLCKLSLIEMKYGMSSLNGDEGIKGHLEDFRKLYEDKDKFNSFSDEMTKVLQQKYYLGLVPGLKAGSSDVLVSKMKSPATMEAVFALGDFNKDSDNLRNELASINPDEYEFDVLFARSPFLGYGLYAQSFISLKDLKKELLN